MLGRIFIAIEDTYMNCHKNNEENEVYMSKSLYNCEEDKLMFKLYNINSEIFKKYEKVSTKDILNELKVVSNPNYQNNDGCTFLHAACETHCIDAIKILLDLGADPNIVDKRGRHIGLMAITGKNENNPKILELLLQHGLDLNVIVHDQTLKQTIESFGNNEYNEIIKKYYKK